ncbi:MAG: magnesium/cobalt transporter CorA [Acidobacteria bacterium]|nr:magnesium/cobalt transporter CorA [Acidobacteriota bacterium]
MRRYIRKTAKRPGTSPGSLVFSGARKAERVDLQVFDYDEGHLHEYGPERVEDFFPSRDSPRTSWLNVDGLHEVGVVEKIGAHFGIHPLVLEDILHQGQRPKIEDFGEYLFLVLKMVDYHEETGLTVEQVSLVLGPHYLITFQETPGDVFDPVRDRIRTGRGRIRKMGADYLAYALVDAVVDHYFVVLERVGERIEHVEENLLRTPSPEGLHGIHLLKKDVMFLRRSIWPLREVIAALERGESRLIRKATAPFLRDLYDHTVQVAETVETFRDMLSGMTDLHLSVLSNRMNEVMKVLTMIATIFIPLTFVAGVYGMNFEFMPELHWRWGYAAFWVLMLGVGAGMLAYFRRKRWL